MTHYIDRGRTICPEPLLTFWPWAGVSSTSIGLDDSAAAPGPGPAPGKLGKGAPKGKAAPTRAKFVCPGCKAAAWGKPGLNLVCGDCQVAMA